MVCASCYESRMGEPPGGRVRGFGTCSACGQGRELYRAAEPLPDVRPVPEEPRPRPVPLTTRTVPVPKAKL